MRVLLTQFLCKGATLTWAAYAQTMEKLTKKRKLKNKAKRNGTTELSLPFRIGSEIGPCGSSQKASTLLSVGGKNV